jgi:putative lipoic acid-binding regulatory protein
MASQFPPGHPLHPAVADAAAQAAQPANPVIPPEQSLIEYPSRFPIKVMGVHHETFIEAVVRIAREHDQTFDEATLEHRPSSSGKYLGLTVTVTATSREQLDAIYRALTGHPLVKYVL